MNLPTTAALDARVSTSACSPLVGRLWFLWAALLAAAIVLGNEALALTAGHGSAPATAARMGSSVVLVVASWLAAGTWQRAAAGRFGLCVAIGMTLGTIGDFFNAGLLNFVPLPDPVLGGIIAFGLGHIAYITGCIDLANRTGLTDRGKMLGEIVGWQLFGLVGWYFVAMQGTEARAIVWPALPYSLLLAGTAGITGGLRAARPALARASRGWRAVSRERSNPGIRIISRPLCLRYGMRLADLRPGPDADRLRCGLRTAGGAQQKLSASALTAQSTDRRIQMLIAPRRARRLWQS